MTEVDVFPVIVAGWVPKRTRTVFVRFVPEITIEDVPPAIVPFVIERLVIFGAGTAALTS